MNNNIDKYYRSFGLDRSLPRSFLKNQELNQLFAIPKKETHEEMPHFYNFVEDDTHQAETRAEAVLALLNKQSSTISICWAVFGFSCSNEPICEFSTRSESACISRLCLFCSSTNVCGYSLPS